jgi:hypothetical protein
MLARGAALKELDIGLGDDVLRFAAVLERA